VANHLQLDSFAVPVSPATGAIPDSVRRIAEPWNAALRRTVFIAVAVSPATGAIPESARTIAGPWSVVLRRTVFIAVHVEAAGGAIQEPARMTASVWNAGLLHTLVVHAGRVRIGTGATRALARMTAGQPNAELRFICTIAVRATLAIDARWGNV